MLRPPASCLSPNPLGSGSESLHLAGMAAPFPACPFLPPPRDDMNWRAFSAHGQDRGIGFYVTALQYGNSLWHRGLAARAVLCLDRAFGADLKGDEEALQHWPLPYASMAWILRNTPSGVFIGNPRVHFQHYADRLKGPRWEQRKWRAWACWEIARVIHPELPGDPRHPVAEPSRDLIAERLSEFGLPGEAALWRAAL